MGLGLLLTCGGSPGHVCPDAGEVFLAVEADTVALTTIAAQLEAEGWGLSVASDGQRQALAPTCARCAKKTGKILRGEGQEAPDWRPLVKALAKS